MVRRSSPRQRWLDWFAEYEACDLTIAEFCAGKGVSQQSFYKWRRKLRDQLQQAPESSPFVSLKVMGQSAIQIALPCGARIEVPSEDMSLRPVLKVLLELGAQS
jgi:transposase-like protein